MILTYLRAEIYHIYSYEKIIFFIYYLGNTQVKLNIFLKDTTLLPNFYK